MGDYFKKTRWEGESLAYKVKFAYAKYPILMLSCIGTLIVSTVAGSYNWITYEGSRYQALEKYKSSYIVVRDDDPKMDYIMSQKERGQHFFPKY